MISVYFWVIKKHWKELGSLSSLFYLNKGAGLRPTEDEDPQDPQEDEGERKEENNSHLKDT